MKSFGALRVKKNAVDLPAPLPVGLTNRPAAMPKEIEANNAATATASATYCQNSFINRVDSDATLVRQPPRCTRPRVTVRSSPFFGEDSPTLMVPPAAAELEVAGGVALEAEADALNQGE